MLQYRTVRGETVCGCLFLCVAEGWEGRFFKLYILYLFLGNLLTLGVFSCKFYFSSFYIRLQYSELKEYVTQKWKLCDENEKN